MYIKDIDRGENTAAAQEIAEEFITPNRLKLIKRELEGLMDDEYERLSDYAADYISQTATSRAEAFIRRVLDGDQSAAASLFGVHDSSRYRTGNEEGKPWTSLIRGTLFETDSIRLRRKLVETHGEFLVSERIKDLESIVLGLTQQIQQLEGQLHNNDYRYSYRQ